jgi:U3 small nucleolar RNA-associated protein 11
MSSLRNAIPRPAHKERSQPEARKRFGILEKHKDYIIRANAYHKKQETLKILRQKAAFKNPDEFNFKMINSKTVDGRHRPKDEVNKYSAEELMIMKTQDIGYVFQKWQSEKNKIDKLTASLQCTGDQSSRRHVYYAEDRLIPTFSPFFTWCSFRDFLIHFECVIWTLQNLILLTLTFKRHYRYHIVCVFL